MNLNQIVEPNLYPKFQHGGLLDINPRSQEADTTPSYVLGHRRVKYGPLLYLCQTCANSSEYMVKEAPG